MLRRTSRAILLALSISILAASTIGCFGSFKLVHGIYGFNRDVTRNKILQSAILLGMIIIPVYEIGALADWIIFNVIEFWSGGGVSRATSGPAIEAAIGDPDGLGTQAQRAVEISPTETLHLRKTDATTVGIEIRREGEPSSMWTYEWSGDGLVLRDANGILIASVETAGSGYDVVDSKGRTIAHYSDEAADAMLASLLRAHGESTR